MKDNSLLNNSRIFCITFNIEEQFGGMTTSLLKRAKVFGEQKNIPVTVVTFAMNYELRSNVEKLRGNKLGKQTDVVNLYEFFSGERFIATHLKEYEISNLGEAVSKDKGKKHYKIFQNGKLIMKKDFETFNGKLSHIYYYNDELIVYKKDEYDKNGYLRRTIYYNTSNKKMKQVLFYRMDETCYLTKELDYIEDKYVVKKIYNFDKKNNVINEFNSDEEMRQYFLDCLTGEKKHNFFIVDSKAMYPEMINYINKNDNEVYKIYMNHSAHMNSPYKFDSSIRKKMQPIYNNINKHDAIIVLTNEQKKDIEMRFGNINNCFVIPHSFSGKCDIGNFKNRQLNKVVSVTRFNEGKQINHQIQAFSKVVKEVPNAILEFYGFGDYESEMRKLISELKLDSNVVIRGFTNDISSVFKSSAFTIMSSKVEGQGLVILESLSYGCPVISYDTKYGPKEIIKNGENGYVTEYNNIDALAEKIIYLLKNPEKIELLSQNCKYSLLDYTDKIFMENWLNLFEILIKRRIIQKNLNNQSLDVSQSKWIDLENKVFLINTKYKDDSNLSKKIDFEKSKYTLVNRTSNYRIDINLDCFNKNNREYLLVSHLDFNKYRINSGYWDLYLNLHIDGELNMLRCGTLNPVEQFNELKYETNKLIKPYYTIYKNLTIHIKQME